MQEANIPCGEIPHFDTTKLDPSLLLAAACAVFGFFWAMAKKDFIEAQKIKRKLEALQPKFQAQLAELESKKKDAVLAAFEHKFLTSSSQVCIYYI